MFEFMQLYNINNVDYCINKIDDMQNEKDFLNHFKSLKIFSIL